MFEFLSSKWKWKPGSICFSFTFTCSIGLSIEKTVYLCAVFMLFKPSFDLLSTRFSHLITLSFILTFITSLKFVGLLGFPPGDKLFHLPINVQSQYFGMFVICSSGAFRATLSCSLRPSERSLSSQTSRLSPHILMSCMRIPNLSLEDRCVCSSMTLIVFTWFILNLLI